MNAKEIGEIKRRVRRDRSNMQNIHGCYVRGNGEVIAKFKMPVSTMPENEADKFMGIFKKVLSGAPGKVLRNISFPTKMVSNHDPRHERLMALRRTAASEESELEALYQSIIASVQMDTNYLILVGCDVYDVPFKAKDDTECGESDETFTYLLCAVCPVKETAPTLHYVHEESLFRDGGMLQSVGKPDIGFMFPAFDGRATNIYAALMYNKNTAQDCSDFVDAVFGTPAEAPADIQKASFNAILSSQLDEDCSIAVVSSLHDRAAQMAQMHKESKIPELLTVDRNSVENLLGDSDLTAEQINDIGDAFEETFGSSAEVPLGNIVDTKHYTLKTSSAVIRAAIDCAQEIEIRTIGGRRFICIPADEDVEVNGITVKK